FGVPFVIIRSLSDIAGAEAKVSYDEFLETASVNSANLVLAIVGRLG
ncbi:5'-methylthioadenosine/S-adenosylhomocysteine nucleosidase, partial [Halalkalibacterium halodurans]|nr:5'-methylthioadenosine/S-adenosylhomocysteine nucleosidase [Halalkalibacterium halodurans]